MKKNLFTAWSLATMLATAGLWSVDAQAQFPEGFDAGVPPAGWSIDDVVPDARIWESTGTTHSGAGAAFVRYSDGVGASEDYLISPLFTPLAGEELTFWEREAFGTDYGSVYSVLVSTTGTATGDFSASLWTRTENGSLTYSLQTVSLAAYVGTPIYIAFVNANDDGDSWYVDDVDVAAPPAPPANDDCAGAVALTVGSGSCGTATSGTNVAATDSGTPHSCAGYSGGDVWYSVTVPASGNITIETSTNGGFTDGGMQAYSSSCGSLVSIECDDDDGPGAMSQLALTGRTPSEVIYVAVWEFSNDAVGTFDICAWDPPGPPANDDCAGAETLTVNGDLLCGSFASGTLDQATASADGETCSGTFDNDVWYTFEATATEHVISVTNIVGSSTDMIYQFSEGTCGSLSEISCHDTPDDGFTASGLTIGTDYYIRVDTWTGTTSDTDFDICVGTAPPPPPAPANDDCAGAVALAIGTGSCGAAISGTNVSATDSGTPHSCAGYSGGDVWYSVTVPASGNITIETSTNGGFTDGGMQAYSSSCGSLVSIECDDDDGPGAMSQLALTGRTPSEVIYVAVWELGDNAFGTFDICAWEPPAPPANDDCAGAETLTVNGDLLCGSFASGTLDLATASADGETCSGTFDNDVWYTFEATATEHVISVTNIVGSSIDMIYQFSEGTCGSLSEISCHDTPDDGFTASGLTIGTDYYIRVDTWTSTTSDTDFDICVGTPPPPPPAPANDDCAGAVALAIGTGSCGAAISGTNVSATDSGTPHSCAGYAGGDVWYSVTVPASGNITIETSTNGGFTDGGMQAYSSSCGSLVSIECDDDDGPGAMSQLALTGRTPSEVIYVAVWELGDNAFGTFDICAWDPPGPPANDDCAGAETLTVNGDLLCGSFASGTLDQATASADGETCSGTFDNDVWYTFEATATEHVISVTSIVGSSTDMIYQFSEGTCGSLSEISCHDSPDDGFTASGLTIGTDYYIRVDTWTSTTSDTEFDICVGTAPPPPANDDCAGAEAISCNSVTSGTTVSSTDDGAPGCGTASYEGDQGVWYVLDGWDGSMSASTCDDADFDTKISVFSGSCGALVCVDGNDDGAGCSGFSSYVEWAGSSSDTYYILVHSYTPFGDPTVTGDFDLTVTCSDQIVPCPIGENTLALELNTDAAGGETSYGIEAMGIPGVELCSGSGFASMGSFGESCCLPDGCYQLRVYDSGSDGIAAPGGYILRDGNGERIIDNDGNFLTGGLSAMSNTALDNRYFCLPLGTDKMIASHCDKENFNETDFLIASANPAVLAEFGGPNASTSGYQWKIFNPNGGYIRHLARTHTNLAAGVAPGPSAVQSIRPSNWWTLPVPGDELMNVRIRTRVAGVWSAYGPACRHMWVSAQPLCPITQLVDDVNNSNHSCGVTRTFGGSDKLVAWSVPGAGAYRFTFKVVGEPTTFVRYSLTNVRQLFWGSNTMPLDAPYEVSVAVRMGGPGDPWCDDGPACLVSILSPSMAPPQTREAAANTGLALWPNPNSGSVLNLRLDQISADVDEVVVEIYDAFGKRVHGEAFADPGNSINTVLDLNSNLANGIYMVNVIVGNEVMTQRLVVQ